MKRNNAQMYKTIKNTTMVPTVAGIDKSLVSNVHLPTIQFNIYYQMLSSLEAIIRSQLGDIFLF